MAKHRKARAVGFNHVALEVGDIEQWDQLGTAQLLFSPQGLCCLLEIDAHHARGHSNS